jgi:hypothetical protein
MIFDADLMFSDAQAVTATAVSDTVIDCGQALLTTGLNRKGELFAVAVAVGDYTGTGTITVELQDCDTDSGTFRTVATSAPVTGDDFVSIVVPMPLSHKRYLKLNYKVDGTVSGGKITAGISKSADLPQIIPTEDYTF